MFDTFIHTESIALRAEGEDYSYGQLADLADAYLSHLSPRTLVFILAANNVASIAFYVGCLRRNVVPLLLNANSSKDFVHALAEEYRPEYIWAPEDRVADMTHVFDDRGYVLARVSDASPELNKDLALLLSTSGSTGSPKLVRLSLKNLESNAASIAEYLGIRTTDRAITTLPFAYSYGLSIINSHLLTGASLVLNEYPLVSREFWNLLSQKAATTFGGVPYTYHILDRLKFAQMDLPSLRYLTQAGGHLDEAAQKKFAEICAEKSIDFFVMYGQTEATARISYLPPKKCLDKLGSIGKEIPGGRLFLVDQDGNNVSGAHIEGELIYRGPNVSMGYATSKADLEKGDELNGILKTGDIAYRDNEGYYYITGRKSRFLKVFGNRIGLDELEALLASHGIIAMATGKDDHVVVVTENNDVARIQEVLTRATKINHSAFDVRHIEKLPRNATGKLHYDAIGQFLEGADNEQNRK